MKKSFMVWVKFFGEAGPGITDVSQVSILFLHGMICDFHHVASFKHKRHWIFSHKLWLLLAMARFFEDCGFWTMAAHAWVEAWCSRTKAELLGVINSCDVAHELWHGVPVVIRGSERMFCYQPSRGEDYKIDDGLARIVALASQHCEDAGIWMVVTNGPNCVVLSQIVLVRCVISMPSYHIKWGVVYFVLKEFSRKFVNNLPFVTAVFVPGLWSLEVARVCQTVSSDRPKIRQNKMWFVSFTNPASGGLRDFDFKLDAPLYDADLLGTDEHPSEFGGNKKCSLLRHNQ